jgi:hypothetical protein
LFRKKYFFFGIDKENLVLAREYTSQLKIEKKTIASHSLRDHGNSTAITRILRDKAKELQDLSKISMKRDHRDSIKRITNFQAN